MSNHKFIYSILFSHRIILFLGIVILFSGCANEDEPEQGPVNRTVLIYMLSNNNLGSTYRFDTQNINDMLQVAASGGLNGGNLIIYRDGYDTNPQLIQIRKNESGSAEKAIIKEYPDRNSATTEVMRSVIDETKELFPAKEYGLILWSHSTGWAPGNSSLALSPARRYELPTRSFGQDGKNYMEIDELAEAIPDKQFHFILTDVCFMGGIECAYQLRNKTDYYIGSAAEVLGAGMPYSLTIPKLFDYHLDLKDVCNTIYTYYNAQSGAYRTSTVGLVDCHRLEALADSIHEIFEAHRNDAMPDISNIQHFDRQPPYICFDLQDFLSQIATPDENTGLEQALSQAILYHAATPSVMGDVSIYKHCGLSCYILGTGNTTQAQGYSGTVKEIQIFNTILNTPDNKTIIIPNGGLSTGSLNNYSKEGRRRVDWKIGIAYGDDFDTARKAILELLAADKRVFDDPAPFVVLSSLADSAIEITVRVWTASENYWGVFFDFNEQVYKQFDKYGLHFPYPQVDVHMIQDNQ